MPLGHFLILSILLFCIGLFGALSRRNSIAILMSIELILNATVLNLVAFNATVKNSPSADGQTLGLFVIGIAAAGAIVGLALIFSIWRQTRNIFSDEITLLKG
ncbi:MAG: NADH-quinone oxidoreductase subunit NuoK [Candidatus Omnitrophica bacterium]|nr:NADH-quinone oxidoreductase subunit NuoK [Candidatus Omnitrophota bacterium]